MTKWQKFNEEKYFLQFFLGCNKIRVFSGPYERRNSEIDQVGFRDVPKKLTVTI